MDTSARLRSLRAQLQGSDTALLLDSNSDSHGRHGYICKAALARGPAAGPCDRQARTTCMGAPAMLRSPRAHLQDSNTMLVFQGTTTGRHLPHAWARLQCRACSGPM
eukprot:1161268-Pelagomonas_calceolata.AAC.10